MDQSISNPDDSGTNSTKQFSSHLQMGNPVYTLGNGAGNNSIKWVSLVNCKEQANQYLKKKFEASNKDILNFSN